jgi:ribosome-associated heat shock protein Hsp15
VVKTRSLAQSLVAAGQVRLNRVKLAKPAHDVALGDVLTVAVAGHVRVLKVTGFAERRGAAPMARLLYEELDPAATDAASAQKLDATPPGTC